MSMFRCCFELRQVPEEFGSCFPKAEARLEDRPRLKGLVRGHYRSRMDRVVVTVFPEHALACRRYYKGLGPKLIKRTTPQERLQMEQALLAYIDSH